MTRSKLLGVLTGLVMLVRCGASAQSFTFVPDDTVLSAPLGSTIEFNVTITNTSTSTLTLALIRTLNNLPNGWESSMCLASCFPPTTDSILTTTEFGSSPLNPGESRPFSVDVFTAVNQGTGTVRIVARNTRNASDERVLTFTAISLPTSVENNMGDPISFSLSQNYPNPFNPTTAIRFSIPVGTYGYTSLQVFDVLGREVATLVNEKKQAGNYEVRFDASSLASGVYVYTIVSGDFVATRRMILMR